MNSISDSDYESKYLKYKAKYLELLKLAGGGRYRDGLQLQILTINDPYCKGVNTGDVDDWYSIIFLAQKFRNNLDILIVNSNQRRSKRDYQYMEAFLKTTYGCNFLYDEDQSTEFLETDYKMCFISAPLPNYVLTHFKETYDKKTLFYIQGGKAGYNAKSSQYFPPGSSELLKASLFSEMFNWKNVPSNRMIFLESDQTSQSYEIKKLNNYMTNPICVNWNSYQIKKIFSVIPSTSPQNYLPYGFWFGPTTSNLWRGTGNTKNTMDVIMSSIEPATFERYKRENSHKFSSILIGAYHSYIDRLCEIKAAKESVTDREFIISQANQLKKIYDHNVIPLAHYLIGNWEPVTTEITRKVEELLIKDGLNKDIGDIGELGINEKVSTQTPKLFDFNVSAFVIDMYEQRQPKFEDLLKEKQYRFKDEIDKYIHEQRSQNYSRTIDILNKVLENFTKDLFKYQLGDIFA